MGNEDINFDSYIYKIFTESKDARRQYEELYELNRDRPRKNIGGFVQVHVADNDRRVVQIDIRAYQPGGVRFF